MLPLPELDDQTFDQIIKKAREMIPLVAPDWTDENYHDPGITLLELFAWISEMLQYYLNRVTAANERKFLKLLGIKPLPAEPARVEVTFEDLTRNFFLPRGTRLMASDIPFETAENIQLLPVQLERVIVSGVRGEEDCTLTNSYQGVSYYAFDRQPFRGNRLYLGFNRALPAGENISLTIKMAEQSPPLKYLDEQFVPSARISWMYYGCSENVKRDGNGSWRPLQLINDGTNNLVLNGRLVLQIPGQMLPARIYPAEDKDCFWICAELTEGVYEMPPRLDRIFINTILALQRRTQLECVSFSGSGQPNLTLTYRSFLSFYGLNRLQVCSAPGLWQDWQETDDLSAAGPGDHFYTINKDEKSQNIYIHFGDGKNGMIPSAGKDNIRLVSSDHTYAVNKFTGRGNGLPGQILDLPVTSVMRRGFMLQVAEKDLLKDSIIWRDWQIVDDFDASRSCDHHYILREERGEILFGNNERGLAPETADRDNIRIISCATGSGTGGNVKEGEISYLDGFFDQLDEVKVINYYPASGGRFTETLEECKHRARDSLKSQSRAVTCADYEEIVLKTPGLGVARAKAIPLYIPGLPDYPVNTAPAHMTVVVVPLGETAKPLPGPGFLKTIKRRLENYRLITTQVHVIPPQYIKVTVHAVVVVASPLETGPQKIIAALKDLLHPLDGLKGHPGWPFGRTVYKGDIFGAISQVAGVEFIKDMWFEADGEGARRDARGDVAIPPYGLVYSGEHQIEVVSQADL